MPISTLILLLPLALFAPVSAEEEEGYRNFSIFQINDPSQNSHAILTENSHLVDILSMDEDSVVAMIPPKILAEVQQLLDKAKLKYRVVSNDVQRDVDEDHKQRQLRRGRRKRAASWGDYLNHFLSLTEMEAFQKEIIEHSKAHVEQITIGQSAEKRDIKMIKIKQQNNGKRKRTIFIDAGIHAREWIAPATANYIIYQLAIGQDVNSDLLTNFDWEIVPVLNPDGYAYSHSSTSRRFWRKNRQRNEEGSCIGTDLNRNFGYPAHLPGVGGSRITCADIYSGPKKLSAPESRALSNHLLSKNSTIVAYLSLHSFGRYILYPWGYSTSQVPRDAPELERVAQVANSDPLMSSRYKIGTSAQTLYPAAGGSDDYAKGAAGIKYSYTFELPPWQNSTFTFAPPEHAIAGFVREAWAGIKALVRELNMRTRLPPLTKVSSPPSTTTTTTTTTTTPATATKLNMGVVMPTNYSEYMQYILGLLRDRFQNGDSGYVFGK